MFGSIFSDVKARVARISDDPLIVDVNIILKPKVLKMYFMIFFEPIKITRLIK
jgi:hypothetical protein